MPHRPTSSDGQSSVFVSSNPIRLRYHLPKIARRYARLSLAIGGFGSAAVPTVSHRRRTVRHGILPNPKSHGARYRGIATAYPGAGPGWRSPRAAKPKLPLGLDLTALPAKGYCFSRRTCSTRWRSFPIHVAFTPQGVGVQHLVLSGNCQTCRGGIILLRVLGRKTRCPHLETRPSQELRAR